jgi:hypothetical protein
MSFDTSDQAALEHKQAAQAQNRSQPTRSITHRGQQRDRRCEGLYNVLTWVSNNPMHCATLVEGTERFWLMVV